MENELRLFDAIDQTAVKWLMYNKDKYKEDIGLSNFNNIEFDNLWLLSICRHYNIFSNRNVYIQTNIFVYFYLRFIKKFNFLRLYKKKLKIFLIDSTIFKKEIIDFFNVHPDTLKQIYIINYKR